MRTKREDTNYQKESASYGQNTGQMGPRSYSRGYGANKYTGGMNQISSAVPKPLSKGEIELRKIKRGGDANAIERVLANVFRCQGLDKKIARYKFILHWKEIVGEQIAKNTRADSIKDETLFVRTVNSSWAQELSFHKLAILRRLRPYLEDTETVRDVRFLVGM